MTENEEKPTSSAIPSQDERNWAMIAHLSAFAGLVLPAVGKIIAPLIIWLTRRDRSRFVESQAREALNFNIFVALVDVACFVLAILYVGFMLWVVVYVVWVVLTIIAAIKASEGVDYRYPVSLRLVK